MRSIIACLSLALSGLPCIAADPLTCADFRKNLAQAIHDGGDKVAQPDQYKIAYKGDDVTRYDFGGIVGIDGSIRCLNGDRFENIAVSADLEVNSDLEAGQRIVRLQAMAAAVICAMERATPQTCVARAKDLFDRSLKDFRQSKVRGEKFPGGDSVKEFPSGTEASMNIVQCGILFQFFAKRAGT